MTIYQLKTQVTFMILILFTYIKCDLEHPNLSISANLLNLRSEQALDTEMLLTFTSSINYSRNTDLIIFCVINPNNTFTNLQTNINPQFFLAFHQSENPHIEKLAQKYTLSPIYRTDSFLLLIFYKKETTARCALKINVEKLTQWGNTQNALLYIDFGINNFGFQVSFLNSLNTSSKTELEHITEQKQKYYQSVNEILNSQTSDVFNLLLGDFSGIETSTPAYPNSLYSHFRHELVPLSDSNNQSNAQKKISNNFWRQNLLRELPTNLPSSTNPTDFWSSFYLKSFLNWDFLKLNILPFNLDFYGQLNIPTYPDLETPEDFSLYDNSVSYQEKRKLVAKLKRVPRYFHKVLLKESIELNSERIQQKNANRRTFGRNLDTNKLEEFNSGNYRRLSGIVDVLSCELEIGLQMILPRLDQLFARKNIVLKIQVSPQEMPESLRGLKMGDFAIFIGILNKNYQLFEFEAPDIRDNTGNLKINVPLSPEFFKSLINEEESIVFNLGLRFVTEEGKVYSMIDEVVEESIDIEGVLSNVNTGVKKCLFTKWLMHGNAQRGVVVEVKLV